MGKLKKHFRKLRDPRAANASYPLLEILVVALAAVLSGAESATDMADFGRRKIEMLRRFLPLEKGTRATTSSATSFACSTRKPSSACSGSSWRRSPNSLI